MSSPVLFWFRRDLRLEDNEAFALAAASGPIVPVFVFDSALTGPSGANRLTFLNESLRNLSVETEQRLVIRSGDPKWILHGLADELGAREVWATDDFGPYGRRRDTEAGEYLAERGIATHYRSSNYVLPPGTLFTKTGTPYKVFTPFFKQWITQIPEMTAGLPPIPWAQPAASGDEIPSGPRPTAALLPPAGHAAAWDRFSVFQNEIIDHYDDTRNSPAIDGTSRLSPYLKWGTIHPRQVIERLGDSPAERSFVRQLCWRDFYAEVLFNQPDSARQPYVAANAVASDTDEQAEGRFDQWKKGQTGYPIVDAGIRQLLHEGWMHNRVRMITASFLVKDLHLPWQWGARFFMEHLVDGDLASNNHGWQWVAGTGTDASPYYRVFNPSSQSAKFDSDGDYLRRWLPELRHLGKSSIHEPWRDPSGAPPDYPKPMVNHAAERAEALDRYSQRSAKR